MTEQFLHYLWRFSIVQLHGLQLTNGVDFSILSIGEYNHFESGPDFSNAKVKMDGIVWCGPIEMHLKSSDWLSHGHQFDEAYNNVVLHVVYEDDMPIIQNGRLLPTLELKSVIPYELIQRYQYLLASKSTIICANRLAEVPSIFLVVMLSKAAVNRLERKVAYLETMINQESHQVFYTLLARSFGSKVNALAFEELTHRIPFSVLKELHLAVRKRALLQVSGIHYEGDDTAIVPLALEPMNPHVWKFKGLRPPSFPNLRIVQFATLLNLIDHKELFDLETLHEVNEYSEKLFRSYNNKVGAGKWSLSSNFQNLLRINCFLPFFIWKSGKSKQVFDMENAVEFLSLLKAEENHILKEWKRWNVIASNAFESQGLIELHQQFCSKKKCLDCTVGIKLMRE